MLECLAQECDQGQYAAKTSGAVSNIEECTDCVVGTYSPGGSTPQCLPMKCPEGQVSKTSKAKTEDEGCIDCAVGT